ncbi:MAG: AAA domain-containing protein [Luteitalea sp.]|nr:AAA domain-containing protein [Luteitalea sp.]
MTRDRDREGGTASPGAGSAWGGAGDVRVRARDQPELEVWTAVSTAWRTTPGGLLRAQFELALTHLAGAASAQIREGTLAPGETASEAAPGLPDRGVLFEVMPGVVLEAVPHDGTGFGPRQMAILHQGVLAAALVVELDRWRTGALRVPSLLGRPMPVPELIGSSPAFQPLLDRVARVARTDFAVLIEGESGVGKELIARRIHALSRRRRGPFVAVNCAALVETLVEAELFGIEERTATGVRGRRGKFEHADGGTLFLDEVADLTLHAQAKLLRALQEMSVERVGGQGTRSVDIRLIAATNRNLLQLVSEGRFRLDLFYRLNCLEIYVPPLRTRRQDIIDLTKALLDRHRALGADDIAPEALEALLGYDWPGNVRELERVIERAVALGNGPVIELEDLPTGVTGRYREVLVPRDEPDETMRAWGSRYARLVLRRCGGRKRKACRILDISYHTLQAYLRYPLRPTDGPPSGFDATDGGGKGEGGKGEGVKG